MTQQDDQDYQQYSIPISDHFKNNLKKLPDPDLQYKETKHKHSALIQKDDYNSAAWQIDSQEKLMIEMYKDPNMVLSVVLNI